MKKKIAVAGLCVLALASQTAMAKSLEDVLKEKGVITEEDYRQIVTDKPAAPAAPTTPAAPAKSAFSDYKIGDGFTFTSTDEKFKGSIGASMQLRYTYLDKDIDKGTSDQSEYRLRRIKLFMNGYAYSKDLTYKLVTALSETGPKFLEETYVNYRLIDEAQLRFGQDKTPFARQELTSTAALEFVDRSFVTDAFKPSFDTGAMLHGRIANGIVGYAVGTFGGLGQGTFRSSNDNSLAARVVFNPLGEMKLIESDVDNSEKPLLSIGADYFRDKLQATFTPATADVTVNTSTGGTYTIKGTKASTALETNNLNFAGSSGWLGKGISNFNQSEKLAIDSASFDAAFKWKGFSAQGEYFLAQAEGDTTGKLLRAQGFYGQAGYFIIPSHLEVAARYGYMDPNRDAANNLQMETQGAISYYFYKHALKLQADYTNIHKQNGANPSTDDKQVRMQAQIVF